MNVFLSSTALDLVAYRQVADDTILRLSQESGREHPVFVRSVSVCVVGGS
jgi:hypothetical protein